MSISNKNLASVLRRHAKARHALSYCARQSLLDAADRLEAAKASEQPMPINKAALDQAAAVRKKYRSDTPVSLYSIEGEDAVFVAAYLEAYGSVASALASSPASDAASAGRDDNPGAPTNQQPVSIGDKVSPVDHQPVQTCEYCRAYPSRIGEPCPLCKPKRESVNHSILPSGWQLIDTAPKDGTHFLACRWTKHTNDFKGFPPMVVHWWAHKGEEGFYLSHGSDGLHPLTLTHWQPLYEIEGERK